VPSPEVLRPEWLARDPVPFPFGLPDTPVRCRDLRERLSRSRAFVAPLPSIALFYSRATPLISLLPVVLLVSRSFFLSTRGRLTGSLNLAFRRLFFRAISSANLLGSSFSPIKTLLVFSFPLPTCAVDEIPPACLSVLVHSFVLVTIRVLITDCFRRSHKDDQRVPQPRFRFFLCRLSLHKYLHSFLFSPSSFPPDLRPPPRSLT